MTRCYICGYKIRGKHHEDGDHHRQADKHRRREKVLEKRRKTK